MVVGTRMASRKAKGKRVLQLPSTTPPPPAPKRRKATSSKKGSKQNTIAHTQPPDAASDFDILPQDIQGRIFSLCNLSALYSAALVCKEWHKLAEEYGDWDQVNAELKPLQDLKDKETCAQQDLVGALLLKPEQVKEMPFKRRSLGWGQYKHVFETKQAVKGLLEKHGGIRGLLERIEKKRMRARPKNWKEDLQASRKAKLERALTIVGLPFIKWRVTKKFIEKGSSVWFDIAIRDSVHLHYMKEHPGEELTDMLLNDWGWDDISPAALDAFAISEPEVSWHEYGRWDPWIDDWFQMKEACTLPDKLPWLQNRGDRSLDLLIQDAMEFGDPGITAKINKAAAAEQRRKDALRERERVLVTCSSFTGINYLRNALSHLGVGPKYRTSNTSGILEDWLSSKKLTVSMDEAVAKQIAKNAGAIHALIEKQLKKRNAAYYDAHQEWTAVRKLHSESEWRVQLCSRSFKTAPVVAALKEVEQEQKRRRELSEALAARTQGLLDCSGFKEKHTLTQVLNELVGYGCYGSYGAWTGALGDYLSPNMMKPTMKEREARTVAKNAFKIYQLVHKYSKETVSGYLSNSFWTYRAEWQAVRKIHGHQWTKELRSSSFKVSPVVKVLKEVALEQERKREEQEKQKKEAAEAGASAELAAPVAFPASDPLGLGVLEAGPSTQAAGVGVDISEVDVDEQRRIEELIREANDIAHQSKALLAALDTA